MKWYGILILLVLWAVFWISIDPLTGLRFWGAYLSALGLVVRGTFYDKFVN